MSASLTDRLEAFLVARQGQWIDAVQFEQFGRQAWRTRISESRRRLEAHGEGTIENRVVRVKRVVVLNGKDCDAGSYKRSQYRYVPARPVSLLDLVEQPTV